MKNFKLFGFVLFLSSGIVFSENSIQATSLKDFSKNYPFLDGQWEGIICASDGNIYFGVSSHSKTHAVHLFCYDMGKKKVKLVGDIGKITGENGNGMIPQGKIHSEIYEDNNILYFTTHWAHRDEKLPYPGGHFMSYDIKKRKFIDYGIPLKGQGLISMVYDPKYKRCYALSCEYPHFKRGSHLIILDVKNRKFYDKGIVQLDKQVCRVLLCDDRGNIYWSATPGKIGKYNPETDTVEFLDVFLPVNTKNLKKDYRKITKEDMWRWITWDKVNKVAYGLITYNSHLFSFSPSNKKLFDLGYFGPEGAEGRPTNLGYAIIPGKKIFYAPWGKGRYTHLMEYDIKEKKFKDYGVIKVGKRKVIEVHSMTIGKDGSLYMVAFVYALEGKDYIVKGRRYMGRKPYQMRFIKIEK